MNRRTFLSAVVSGLLAAPLAAEAQTPAKVYRIGLLEVVPVGSNATNLAAFRQGLRELGYVEGHNVATEYCSADGRAERFPNLARESGLATSLAHPGGNVTGLSAFATEIQRKQGDP